jgi:drug/metabolite transporter superfamily protein YnfA
MSGKTLYYIAAFVGSVIGGYVPAIWGKAGMLSVWSLVFSTFGAIAGILLVYKLNN